MSPRSVPLAVEGGQFLATINTRPHIGLWSPNKVGVKADLIGLHAQLSAALQAGPDDPVSPHEVLQHGNEFPVGPLSRPWLPIP